MFKTTRTWLIDYNHIYTEDPYIWFDMYVLYVILPQSRYFSDCIVHQSPMPPGVLELYLAHYAFASRPHFIEDGVFHKCLKLMEANKQLLHHWYSRGLFSNMI